jgi:hypothetical protein
MSFRISDIRPSLAQFAPQLFFCILFLSPTLAFAASHCSDGMLHVVSIAGWATVEHSRPNAKINSSKQVGLASFGLHAFNLMRPTHGPSTVVIPALGSTGLLTLADC